MYEVHINKKYHFIINIIIIIIFFGGGGKGGGDLEFNQISRKTR